MKTNVNTNEYREEIFIGDRLDYVVELLQKYHAKGEKVFTTFNGHMLFSDTVTMDGAFLMVTGMTKAEFDKAAEKEREEYLAEKAAHKAHIPTLTDEWIDKGHLILDEKYWEKWDKCVPIRLNDLYRGMELGACLDIIKPLNEGCDISEAAKIIDNQNHSGMSFGLVVSMVKSFCDRGIEFATYVN